MKSKSEIILLQIICFLFLCSGKITGIGLIPNLIFGVVTFFLIIALINVTSTNKKNDNHLHSPEKKLEDKLK